VKANNKPRVGTNRNGVGAGLQEKCGFRGRMQHATKFDRFNLLITVDD
jgi:hypothetical protein